MALTQTDIDNIEAAINAIVSWTNGGPAFTATMPNGRLVVSPSKAIADGQMFKSPTAYSAAVTYTDALQTVTESSVVYAPNPTFLPIGPESFDSGKWYVIQGVISATLADQSTTGSSLVGYRGETLEEYLDGDHRKFTTIALPQDQQ